MQVISTDLNRLVIATMVLVSVCNVSPAGIWIKARVPSVRLIHPNERLTVVIDVHVWR